MAHGNFGRELGDRIAAAVAALQDARAAGDDYAVGVHAGELDSLVRLAREHGLDVAVDVEALTVALSAPTLTVAALPASA